MSWGNIFILLAIFLTLVPQVSADICLVPGGTTLTGEAFELETSTDLLELREPIGAIYDTLTNSELDALRGGVFTTDEESTDYHQYLRFGAESNSFLLQPIAVNFLENEDDSLGDFLIIDDTYPFFEWEMEFTEGLESIIQGESLSDTLNQTFSLLGADSIFEEIEINTEENSIQLFINTANDQNIVFFDENYTDSSLDSQGDFSGSVLINDQLIEDASVSIQGQEIILENRLSTQIDVLQEGQTVNYVLPSNNSYNITNIFIPDSGESVKLDINGIITDSLMEGDTIPLNGGDTLSINNILVNSRNALVEINITSNYAFGFEITNIKYRLKADAAVGSAVYVGPGQGVREFLDEPEGMLNPFFDIRYEGLHDENVNDLRVTSRGDHSYELTLTNIRGKEFSDIPFVTNQNDVFKWGNNDSNFWFTEAYNGIRLDNNPNIINMGDYFVVSENEIENAETTDDGAILRYVGINTSERLLTFIDMSTGESRDVTYVFNTTNTSTLGKASNFVVEGNTYAVWVFNTSDYPIIVDLNGDGSVSGKKVGFTTRGGAIINFYHPKQLSYPPEIWFDGEWIGMNVTIPQNQFDDSSLGSEFLWWNISPAPNQELSLTLNSSYHDGPHSGNKLYNTFELLRDEDNEDYSYGMLDYGALIEYYNPLNNNDIEELRILLPETQVGAQAFVVTGLSERVCETPVCGNGILEQNETCETCPEDVNGTSIPRDEFLIETHSDKLELEEDLGAVYDTVTESELDALSGGEITTIETTDYHQYFRLEDPSNTLNLQGLFVNATENQTEGFLKVSTDKPIFEWEIEFTEGLESNITNGTLSHLTGKSFNMLGATATITEARVNITNKTVSLVLYYANNSIIFSDPSYDNSALDNSSGFNGTVAINGTTISGASLAIIGQTLHNGNIFEITSIKYRFKPNQEMFTVSSSHGVREHLDEPNGMLGPFFDIYFDGLQDVIVLGSPQTIAKVYLIGDETEILMCELESYCGNGDIEEWETCSSCPQDAGSCPAPASTNSGGGGGGGGGYFPPVNEPEEVLENESDTVELNDSVETIVETPVEEVIVPEVEEIVNETTEPDNLITGAFLGVGTKAWTGVGVLVLVVFSALALVLWRRTK